MSGAAETLHAQRVRDARAHIVAEHHRAQQRRAAAPFALGHRQRGRHDAAAGVHQRQVVSIVGLVGMRVHAVGQRRIDRRGHDAAADHAGFGRASLRRRKLDRPAARQQSRARHDRRQRVEQMVFRALDDRRRQRTARRLREVGAQRPHER